MTSTPSAAYVHCEAQLRSEDYDAWLAALFAPVEHRPHLHALGAFALEVGRVRERVRQPMAGEIRLQWWQDVVDGSRASEAAANPVAAALVDTIARAALPPSLFGGWIDALRIALYDEPTADVPALEKQLASTYGTPVRLAIRVLGVGAVLDSAAADAGVALGLSHLLHVLQGPNNRPVVLPLDLLGRHGLQQADVDARTPASALTSAASELRMAAMKRLAALRARRRTFGEAGPAFLTTALVEPRLKLMGRAGDSPSGLPRDITPVLRHWRLWRAARKGGAL